MLFPCPIDCWPEVNRDRSAYLATFHRKIGPFDRREVPQRALVAAEHRNFLPALPGSGGPCRFRDSCASRAQRLSYVDKIVGQHSQTNPSFHSVHTALQAAPQAVSPLQYTIALVDNAQIRVERPEPHNPRAPLGAGKKGQRRCPERAVRRRR